MSENYDEDLRNRIMYWLTEDGDFGGCSDRAILESECQRIYPNLYAALVTKRQIHRFFKFELESALTKDL